MPLIMIVDDQVEAALLLKAVLRRAGYSDIDVLTDPFAALEACQAAAPDLLITDQRMPGMSGLQLLEALRTALAPAFYPATLVVTGDDEPETVRQAQETGVSRFLVKPIDIRELNECVGELIEARKTAA